MAVQALMIRRGFQVQVVERAIQKDQEAKESGKKKEEEPKPQPDSGRLKLNKKLNQIRAFVVRVFRRKRNNQDGFDNPAMEIEGDE